MKTKDKTIIVTEKNKADVEAMNADDLQLFQALRNMLLEIMPVNDDSTYHELALEWSENGALVVLDNIRQYIHSQLRQLQSDVQKLRIDVNKLQGFSAASGTFASASSISGSSNVGTISLSNNRIR